MFRAGQVSEGLKVSGVGQREQSGQEVGGECEQPKDIAFQGLKQTALVLGFSRRRTKVRMSQYEDCFDRRLMVTLG